MCGTQAVDDLLESLPQILGRNARVVIVGNRLDRAGRALLRQEGVAVVTDPEREAYRAADLERGVARTFLNAGAARAYRQARREGHRVTGLFGDLTQLGGTIVTDHPRKLLFLHRCAFASDHVDPKRVIAALV